LCLLLRCFTLDPSQFYLSNPDFGGAGRGGGAGYFKGLDKPFVLDKVRGKVDPEFVPLHLRRVSSGGSQKRKRKNLEDTMEVESKKKKKKKKSC